MFSVAVSVPRNKDKFDMNKVTDDDGEAVRTKILNCDVYIGNRVVAATVLRWPNVRYQCPNAPVQWPDVLKGCRGKINTWADIAAFCDEEYIENNLYPQAAHAESRTLDYFKENDKIRKNSKDDLMVFYVRDSPCGETCTNPGNTRNILSKIPAIRNWKNYVVVFSDVFRPDDNNNNRVNALRGSLERLGYAIAEKGTKEEEKKSNGLKHIFRCYRQQNMNDMKCLIYNTNGAVADKCIKTAWQQRGERE